MKLIFWGLIFLFFDFNLNFGASSISLLPAFVGYALIRTGMGRVTECERYGKARSWMLAGIAYSAVVWVLNLLGMPAGSALGFVLGVAGGVFLLVATWQIAKGVAELEGVCRYDLYAKPLMTAWTVLLIWVILVRVTAWLGIELLAMIALLASFVFMIYYIVRFHKSRKAYEERAGWQEGDA